MLSIRLGSQYSLEYPKLLLQPDTNSKAILGINGTKTDPFTL